MVPFIMISSVLETVFGRIILFLARAASLLMSAAEHRLEETVQGGGECNSVILQARLARDLVHFQYPGNQAVAIW